MNYGFDEYDRSIYDARSSEDDKPAGGLAVGGSFGGQIDQYRGETPTMRYINRINPNLAIGGLMMIGGMIVLSSLVNGLGKANPNNQMLQAQALQAEANKEVVQAQADALKTVANQRPACIALFCSMPAEPVQPAQPVTEQPQQPQYPDYYEQPYSEPVPAPVQPAPSIAPAPTAAVPTDATTVAFWQYYQNDADYIGQWRQYCEPNWIIQPECRALYRALYQ